MLKQNDSLNVSIITINRNNHTGLRKTIESVVSQTNYDFEYIVIDGASTDGSVETIQRFNNSTIQHFQWISEPDSGIYNAMNKGIKKAKGEYLLFLNSGDILVDNKVVADFIQNKFDSDIVSGVLCEESKEGKQRIPPTVDNIDFEYFYLDTLPHSATFIKASIFEKIGFYNEENKIVSDWEFFFNALVIKNCSYEKWNRLVSVFDMTGISSMTQNNQKEAEEKIRAMKLYLPSVYKTYIKQQETINQLKVQEKRYNEYMSLRSGFSLFVVRVLLWIKRKRKK